jgi:hypothetical protein
MKPTRNIGGVPAGRKMLVQREDGQRGWQEEVNTEGARPENTNANGGGEGVNSSFGDCRLFRHAGADVPSTRRAGQPKRIDPLEQPP